MTEPRPNPTRHKLRVIDIFLLTTTVAVVAGARVAWMDWDSFQSETHGYMRIASLFFSLMFGLALAGLALILWRRWARGQAFPEAPGHWLLLSVASLALVVGSLTVLSTIYESRWPAMHARFPAWHMTMIAGHLTIAVVAVVFACLLRGSWWWKCALILPALLWLFIGLSVLSSVLGNWRPWFAASRMIGQVATGACVGVLVIVACYRERGRDQQRDWLHWLGVGVVLTYSLLAMVDGCYWLSRLR